MSALLTAPSADKARKGTDTKPLVVVVGPYEKDGYSYAFCAREDKPDVMSLCRRTGAGAWRADSSPEAISRVLLTGEVVLGSDVLTAVIIAAEKAAEDAGDPSPIEAVLAALDGSAEDGPETEEESETEA